MRLPLRSLAGCALVLASACAGDCGCGDKADSSSSARTPAPISAAPADAGPRRRIEPSDPPLPPGELRDAIESARAEVRWEGPLGKPVEAASLTAALPEALGGFRASTEAIAGGRQADTTAPVAVREYVSGKKTLRLKISDTANAPALRASLDERLLVVGGEVAGNQRGAIIAGAPGVEAFHPKARVSRAVVLARGRFLVEAVVRETDAVDDARRVIESMVLESIKVPVEKKGGGAGRAR